MSRRGLMCENCKSHNTVMFVDFTFLIPTSKLHNVFKTDFRKKEFELWGAESRPRDWVCKDCGHTTIAEQLKGK